MNKSSQPNAERLNELVRCLTTEIDIERIYMRKIETGEKIMEQLFILRAKTCSKATTEVQFLIDMFFKEEQYYCYKLYQASKVKDAIHQGRLRFYTICTEKALLYRKPNSTYRLFPEQVDVSWLFQKAEKDYLKEAEKINYFEKGAQFYMEQENDAFAAYMVQQAMEMSYRAIELWIVGMDRITHSIAGHQRYLAPYVPELGTLFSSDKKEDIIALSLLDDAYLDVRYKTNYHIAKDMLLYCVEKLNQLIPWVRQSYQELLLSFKMHYEGAYPSRGAYVQVMHDASVVGKEKNRDEAILATTQIKESEISESRIDEDLQEMIRELCTGLNISQIYCFGHRSERQSVQKLIGKNVETYHNHYDLLLVTDEEVAKAAMQEGRINAMNEANRVTLIAHGRSGVEKALNENNRFFRQVLEKGTLLFGEGIVIPEVDLNPTDEKLMKSHMERVWFRRITRARAFLASAYAALDEAYEDVPVSLLNQFMEQVCLGLIEVFLGYQPNRHKLHHLLNLCQNFSGIVVDIFPRRTESDRKLFKLLDQGVHDIRFRQEWCVNPADIDLLNRKCKNFLQKADETVKEYLAIPAT